MLFKAILWCLVLFPQCLFGEEVLEYVSGPMKVGNGCHDPNSMPKQLVPVRFEKDVWVTRSEFELVDKHGNALPNQLLCHSVIAAAENFHSTTVMPELSWDSTKPTVNFPAGTGVLMRAKTPYNWEVVWKNPYGKDFPEGYLKVRLYTRPVTPDDQLKNLVTDCVSVYPDHPAGLYFVPPGKSHREKEVSFQTEGQAVMLAGHIHQHGTRLALEQISGSGDTANKVVWEGTIKGDPHGEFSLPATVLDTPREMRKSDRYRIIVDYDNTSDRDWPAMGFVCALTVPKSLSSEVVAANNR